MKRLIYLILFTLAIAHVNAQKITRLEYFFDEDPGFGFATPIDIAPDAAMVNNFNFTASTVGLTIGYHNFYFRTLNDSGQWSHTYQRQIEVFPSYQPIKISRGEYYIDEDFGFGFGTSFPIIGGAGQNVTTNLNIPTNSLPNGNHLLIFRMLDSLGRWSQTYTRTFEKVEDQNPQIIAYEYAVNVDPGFGLATRVNVSTPFVDDEITFNIPVTGLPEGAAKAYIRTLNSNGKWSQTMIKDFSVCNSLPNVVITYTGNTAICGTGSVTLNAPIGTGYTYVWKKDAVSISSATNAIYNASQTGAYTVVVTTPSGCSAESQAVNITQSSNPTASITSSLTTMCSNDSTPISANAGTGLTYQWRKNSVNVGIGSSTYYATTAGAYTVVVTNAAGCSALSNTINITTNPAPNAFIQGNDTVQFCVGANTTLQAQTGTGYTYVWKNGGIPISGATGSSYTTNSSGNYTVTVTAGTCNATSAITYVIVNQLPAATATTNGGSTVFCQGSSVTLTANSGSGLLYQWKNGNTIIPTATFQTYVATTSGSYSVTTSNALGCSATSGAIVVTVNPTITPTVSIVNATGAICAGAPVNFTATPTFGGTYPIYQWRINGANVEITNNPNYIVSSLRDNDVVSALMYSNEDCINAPFATSNTITAQINFGNYGLTFSADNTTPTSPFLVNFTNSSTTNTNLRYRWFFGDGTNKIGLNTNHYYPANGVFSVALVAQDTTVLNGCSDTLRINNYITCSGGTGSYNCTQTVSITPNTTVTGCIGGSVLAIGSTNAISPTYQWNLNGAPLGGETNDTIKARLSGVYSLTVYENGGCPVTSNSVSITFNSVAPAPPTVSQTGTLQVCGSNGVTLTASAGFSSYRWNTGATTQTITVNNSGIFNVTGQNAAGCNATSNPTIINNSMVIPPEVCMVTVDTALNNSLVVWDKTSYTAAEVDSFIVFKESNIDYVYKRVGAQPYSQLSEFVYANSNADEESDKYKIAIKDSCGNLTLPSSDYKTMHLQVTPGVGLHRNLSWTHARGITYPYYYRINRKFQNVWTTIDSVRSTTNTYTDVTLTDINVDYIIEIVALPCISTKSMQARVRCTSNGNTNRTLLPSPLTVGMYDFSQSVEFNLYPNPAKDVVTVSFCSNCAESSRFISAQPRLSSKIKITDILGKEQPINCLPSTNDNLLTINTEHLSKGVYFVRVGNTVKKLVVE